jgi:hypothetical protein
MDHSKFEYEVCMDSVTTNQNLEADETKFFWMFMALVHSTAGFGWFALLSPYPKEFLLNKTKPYTTSRCISTDIHG